jgi:aspartyl-tRNA(Asn)/glutamyl-tRNA(Gln) amidotransferase subunit A
MMTIEEFGRRLRAREVTSEQVTEECLQRIEAENGTLNAFICVTADDARRRARGSGSG